MARLCRGRSLHASVRSRLVSRAAREISHGRRRRRTVTCARGLERFQPTDTEPRPALHVHVHPHTGRRPCASARLPRLLRLLARNCSSPSLLCAWGIVAAAPCSARRTLAGILARRLSHDSPSHRSRGLRSSGSGELGARHWVTQFRSLTKVGRDRNSLPRRALACIENDSSSSLLCRCRCSLP